MGAKVREKAAGDRTRRPGTKPWNTGKKGRAFRGLRVKKAAKNPVPSAHSGQTTSRTRGGSAGRAQKRQAACGPENNAAEGGHDCSKPPARPPGAAGNTRRDTDHTSRRKSGRPRKNGQPGTWRGTPDKKNPSEQAKFAFALLPARRGHVNRGRQKIASLFLAGTVFGCALRTMPRAAQNKRGRRPLLSPAAFWKRLAKTLI